MDIETQARAGARALRVARRMQAGQVFVNGYGGAGGIELPFGGMKKSGQWPREGLRGALRLQRRAYAGWSGTIERRGAACRDVAAERCQTMCGPPSRDLQRPDREALGQRARAFRRRGSAALPARARSAMPTKITANRLERERLVKGKKRRCCRARRHVALHEVVLGRQLERLQIEAEQAAIFVGRGVPGHAAIAEIGRADGRASKVPNPGWRRHAARPDGRSDCPVGNRRDRARPGRHPPACCPRASRRVARSARSDRKASRDTACSSGRSGARNRSRVLP